MRTALPSTWLADAVLLLHFGIVVFVVGGLVVIVAGNLRGWRWVNRWWWRLLHLAARLGSDVPLFILGGCVLGLGRGERVFPLREIPLEPMLLIHPGLHVGTPSVYGALPAVGYPLPQALPSLAAGVAPPWRNDLTGAAIFVRPLLAEVRQDLLESGGEPLLCGSGSCWAARYETEARRDHAARALRREHPTWGIWAI